MDQFSATTACSTGEIISFYQSSRETCENNHPLFCAFFFSKCRVTKIGCIIHYTQVHSIHLSPSSILRSHSLYCIQILKYSYNWRQSWSLFFCCQWINRGSVGLVVRALAFHQCGLCSISALGVKWGLSLLVLYYALGGFSRVTPVFPSHQKPTFNLIWFVEQKYYDCKIVIWTLLISCRIIM